jgi:hypothetical protein
LDPLPSLVLLVVLGVQVAMDDTDSDKSLAEGEGIVRMQQNVIMETEILDCSLCFHPLQPEIFQVNM